MTSQPFQLRTDGGSTNSSSSSHQFGGISLIRSQLAAEHRLTSTPTSDDLLPAELTPVVAISNFAPQAPNINSMLLTNPYAGVPPRGRGGSIRNPNNPCDFLPNTQVVLRGGFAPIPRYVADGDPDTKYLAPHYPPKSNDFYELTSDGRLSEVYFENARIRKFRANPGLSILSAELSPAVSEIGGEEAPVAPVSVQQDRVYIGQGYWRQANEKISPIQENNKPSYRHKYAQKPTQIGIQPWKQAQRREPRTNEEFWRASEMPDENEDAFKLPEIEQDGRGNHSQPMKQEELHRSPRKFPQSSIHQSAEGSKDVEHIKRTQSEADVRQGRDTLFERILVQNTAIPSREDTEQSNQEPRRDQAVYSVRHKGSKDQTISNVHQFQQEALTGHVPPYASRHTNIPGDLSGDNPRISRTRSDLESMFLPKPSEGPTANDDISLRATDSNSDRS